MTTERWDLGIIPCTAGKHATGLTPLTLYKGGPFSLMLRHAQQRCARILIMSAKYGLLELSDPVQYYDAYLPTLGPPEREALRERVSAQGGMLGGRTLSYLPRAYHEFLASVHPEAAAAMSRPYRKLPALVAFKILSNEIKNYGQNPARR